MLIPARHIVNLWHIGSLNINDKKDYSLEGNLFSMSQCPSSWNKIARLGQGSLYHSGKGFVLADMISIIHGTRETDTVLRDTILDYGLNNQLCHYKNILKSIYYDDELESEVSELVDEKHLDLYDPTTLVSEKMLLPSNTLKQQHRLTDNIDALEFVAIEWLKKHTECEGVVWMENLDVARYSAPRVGIFDIELSHLTLTQEWPDCESEIELAGNLVDLFLLKDQFKPKTKEKSKIKRKV